MAPECKIIKQKLANNSKKIKNKSHAKKIKFIVNIFTVPFSKCSPEYIEEAIENECSTPYYKMLSSTDEMDRCRYVRHFMYICPMRLRLEILLHCLSICRAYCLSFWLKLSRMATLLGKS